LPKADTGVFCQGITQLLSGAFGGGQQARHDVWMRPGDVCLFGWIREQVEQFRRLNPRDW
jgi:hypothetical protein